MGIARRGMNYVRSRRGDRSELKPGVQRPARSSDEQGIGIIGAMGIGRAPMVPMTERAHIDF
jgi:hypothetical protein